MMFHDPREIRKQRASAPVLIFFGLLFIGIAFLAGREPVRLKHDGVGAPGTVIKLVWQSGSKGSTQHALVRFTASDGSSIQFLDRMGSSPPMYEAGDPVRVLYRENAPAASAIVDRGVWNLVPTYVFAAVGLLFGAFGISMGLQRVPAGASAAPAPAVACTDRSASAAHSSAPQPSSGPKHALVWTLALSGLALALMFAPPSHKTGDAALGVVLCVMAALVAAFGATVNAVVSVFFAGFGAVVATRSGASRGLNVDGPAAQWAACADDSPRLRSLRLRYAHFRRALWSTGIVMLLGGIALMGVNLLTRTGS